jgi:molecular chaperone GrpE
MSADRPEAQIDEAAEDAATDSENSADMSAAGDANPEAQLAELQAKADENWDRYLRAAAEVENIRKRASRDVEKAHKFALEQFGRELLAVRDSLELGLDAGDQASAESLLEGSLATLKLLTSTLERFGIEEVDPAGEPFDPEFHEAIGMQPSDTVEPGSVVNVVQKGYSLNGRLLRPARVIVAAE